jgi:hypothetical protein
MGIKRLTTFLTNHHDPVAHPPTFLPPGSRLLIDASGWAYVLQEACVDGGAMGSTADVEAADEVLGALLGLGHMARGAPYLGGAPFARALLQMLRGVLSEPGEYIPPPHLHAHTHARLRRIVHIYARASPSPWMHEDNLGLCRRLN